MIKLNVLNSSICIELRSRCMHMFPYIYMRLINLYCVWSSISNSQQIAVDHDEERKSPSRKTKKMQEVVQDILNPPEKLKTREWDVIFMISCAIAVFIDPLYCYIAVVDHNKTCYLWDQTLMWTFMGLRSAVDLFYIFNIFIFMQRTNITCDITLRRLRLAASTWSWKKKDDTVFKRKKKSRNRKLFQVLSHIFVALPILQVTATTLAFNFKTHPYIYIYIYLLHAN